MVRCLDPDCHFDLTNFKGSLRPVASDYLLTVLENILNLLVSHQLDSKAAPIADLCDDLADQHEVPQSISTQIISWFGEMKDGRWAMDATEVVKTVGLGVLKPHQVGSLSQSLL